MRITMIALAIVALFAGPAAAQTHQCDVVPPNNPALTSPVKAGFCHAGRDTDGNSTTITAFRVYVYLNGSSNGTLVFEGLPTPIGPPTADGRSYFESPAFVVARGNHAVRVSAVSADGETLGTAYPFVAVGAPPAPPTNTRARK